MSLPNDDSVGGSSSGENTQQNHSSQQAPTTAIKLEEQDKLAYELDNRYQYFRELLKNFSEREESLKEKLLNREHLLGSLYNQDQQLLLETDFSNHGVGLQMPTSMPTTSNQQKAIPTRNENGK